MATEEKIEQLKGQLDFFDLVDISPGEYTAFHGRRLAFNELEEMTGQLVLADLSTQSNELYMAVRIEEIYRYPDGRKRLIYSYGKRKGLVDENHITGGKSRFFEIGR